MVQVSIMQHKRNQGRAEEEGCSARQELLTTIYLPLQYIYIYDRIRAMVSIILQPPAHTYMLF